MRSSIRYLRPIGLTRFFWLNRIVETRSSNSIQDVKQAAERELGAFLAAIGELFGAEEARRAAKDWLDELELQETSGGDLNWRAITVSTTIRLVQRANGHADVDTRVSPQLSSSSFRDQLLTPNSFNRSNGRRTAHGCLATSGPACAVQH